MTRKKEITIYDIAKALNISASTVSRGLRNHESIRKDTRKKILTTARELGYQHNTFASSLRKKRTHTIGLILPRLDSYFMSTVISGIEKVAKQQSYNLIISQSEETMEKEISCISTMYNSRVDGLLFSMADNTVNLDHLEMFFNKGIPVVFFDRVFEHPDYISIVIDNFKAGYEITSHLIVQGCKRIVHLGGNLICNVYRDRYNGYKKALKEHGVLFDPELVSTGPMNEAAGHDVVERMIRMDELPDGIFAANDTSAVASVCRLKKEGIRVPEDVCVAGFNNVPITRVIDPNLTTVHYPGQEMGEVAASTLINKLDNSNSSNPDTIVLKHELIVRLSSARNKR
ncbi:MAG: LacI family DNA-binding transcriptional regulator [Bacteroidales bacterium]|nr:LacI family DNA-binding transcriptional regulator [Bacteroidales bacterium]